MKKQLILTVVGGLFWLWTTFAATMPMQTVSQIETQCNGWTFTKEFYLGKTTEQRFFDTFQGDAGKDYAFWFSSSSINVYNPYSVLSFKNGWEFHFKSNLKPSEEFDVVVASQNYGAWTDIVNHAPNRSDIAAQFVFKVSRKVAIGKGAKDVEYQYMRSSDNTIHTVTKNLKFSPTVYTDNECLNIYVAWCGDGILDTKYGEQCDPNDQNKTGWGNGGCDASCKPITTVVEQPKCNSQYNGQTLENLVEWPHLCSVGTYANFKFNAATNTWTWTCNGVAGTTPDQCSAKKKPTPTPDPKCNSDYNGKKFYNKNHPTAWLNAGMKLCNPGEVFSFLGPDAKGMYTWGCKLGNKKTESNECQARELWCGDGIVQSEYGEQCDPNAPLQSSDKICNNKCQWEDKPVYDLALTKKLATNKKKYELGDLVDFTITVYNQGNLPAKNIQVTEYIPEGLILEDAQWTKNGNKATRMVTETLLPGRKVDLSLTMRISDSFKGTKILNKAEISKDNSSEYNTTDKDSTPDQNSDNDCIVGEDNHYIDGDGKKGGDCTPATDEDDHDVVPITIKQETPIVPPFIEKDLIGDKNHKYKVWELVGFRMPFGNTGTQTIRNVKIRDILPLNLAYVSSNIEGVSPILSGLYLSGGVQILEYSGFNLAPGQRGVLYMTGRVLTTNPDARVNRVGIYENNYLWDWDTELYLPTSRAVKIEKTVDKNQVFSGEIVEFTLKVSATEGQFTWLKVVDTLPAGLRALPHTQFLTGQTTATTVTSFATGVNGSGLTTLTWELSFPNGFKTGDSFLLKFKAQLTETSKTKYTNIACVFNPDDPTNPNCDPEDVTPKQQDVQLKIKKYVSDAAAGTWIDDSKQFSNGATAYFKLVIANATASLTGFTVKDRVEGNLTYLDSTDLANNAFTGVITFGPNNPTPPNYTITPKVTTGAGFTDIEWKVAMGSGFFMSGDQLTIIFKAKKNGNQTNIAHVYYPKPNGTEGHDQDPASVTTPSGWWWGWWWGSSWGGGGSYYCGDGRQNGMEFCDWGSQNGSKIIRKGDSLFQNHDNPKSDYDGEYLCTKQCMLERKGDKTLPACFNTQNGSISIMKGEMLPFYWNIEGLLGKRSEKEKTEYIKNSFFLSKTDNTCESKDIGKIDLRTMQCTFAVYGPGKNNSLVVSAFKTDCINVDGWSKANGDLYPAIKSFISQNQNGWFGGSELNHQGQTHNVFDSLDNREYPTLLPLSSKLIISKFGTPSATLIGEGTQSLSSRDIQTFGEYKLSLEKIEFQTCMSAKDDKGNAVYKLSPRKDGYERVCEVDFAVTDSYLVQKSPYGEVSSNTPLKNYQTKRGDSLFDTTKSQKASDYTVPASLSKTYTTFVNKYAKLAKKVEGNLTKVPWKAIYFVSGTAPIDLKATLKSDVLNKPFTLVAREGANIVIKGSLYTNAMIMTKGQIVFDAAGACNGDPAKYGHAGQMVKGIFYAGAGFASRNDQKNTDLYADERCNYGNLHIKGVAIGNLQSVVDARRSELYTWFKWTGGGKTTEEKRDIVINGASVLVEYNPSLRGNLPPGAEEFNKALEVYRK